MVKHFVITAFAVIFSTFLFSSPGISALKSTPKDGKIDPKNVYNPKEDADDLELPMPNSQKLILRAVAIPTSINVEKDKKNIELKYIKDRDFKMGLIEPRDGNELYEKQRDAYISAALRKSDLPREWQAKLKEGDDHAYYLIGKYELTNGQWDAVMGGQNTEQGNAKDSEQSNRPDLPKTSISWYDLQTFLQKYNEWLLKEHPEMVPAIDKNPAFLRLPTEEEWEFAAKNGSNDNSLDNARKDFYPEEGKGVLDYAVMGSENRTLGDPLPIGQRHPNKLKLYDMAGNAAEMVQGGFHYTVAEKGNIRLHGSEGGLVRKGGSFRDTDEKAVYPGAREELRVFSPKNGKDGKDGYIPFRTSDLGARLVLSSAMQPSDARKRKYTEENDALSSGTGLIINLEQKPEKKVRQTGNPEEIVIIDAQGDPLAELEKLYASTQSPMLKSNLSQYRELIRNYNEAYNRQQDSNLLSLVRNAAYKADSLTNIAFRCFELNDRFQTAKQQAGGKAPKEIEDQVNKQLRNHYRNLVTATNLYRQSMDEVLDFPKEAVDAKVSQLMREYSGDDVLNKNFRSNLNTFSSNLELARKGGSNKLSNPKLWEKVIPVKELSALVIKMDQQYNNSKKGK